MAVERTLSIVKPDAVARNLIGEIYSRFERGGLKIVAAKMLRLDKPRAAGFYAEHEGKPFYEGLCAYMTSGPIVVQVLEGEGRHRREPPADGRHQPGGGGAGHHPRGLRRILGRQLGARLGRPGVGAARDCLLLRTIGDSLRPLRPFG